MSGILCWLAPQASRSRRDCAQRLLHVQRLCAAGDWKLIVDELWSKFGLEFNSCCYVLGRSFHHFCSPPSNSVRLVGSLHLSRGPGIRSNLAFRLLVFYLIPVGHVVMESLYLHWTRNS